MNIVVIENVLGSGQVITVLEDFGDSIVERDLKPGEHARIVVSRFKSVVLKECPAQAQTHLEPPARTPDLGHTARRWA